MKNIQSIINEMTLEEKAALCTGATAWTTQAVPRLGVPALLVSDGPNGVRRVPDLNALGAQSLPATSFPTASSLASTWNVDLLHELGQALAEESIALNVDLLLGPGINMKRSPLGGRNFEYFSEDPYLTGELAISFINGVQSKGVGTSLKHFAVNNQEFERFSISAAVDERTLREIYLAAFERVVKQSKPWSVMCAYNKVNGKYASEHHELLIDILKEEWGFEGFIVSDWGAVHDRVAALNAGLDLEMPGPRDQRVKAVVEAVLSGQLAETMLNESVRRILQIVQKATETPKGGQFDAKGHHGLAHKLAAEGIVLLKNNGILPLSAEPCIAVIGRAAKNARFQGGGSSHVNPTQVDVPFIELQNQVPESELVYADGYSADDSFDQGLIDQAVTVAQAATVAIVFVALSAYKEVEGGDRADLDLSVQQTALIKAVTSVQPRTIVVLNSGSAVVMHEWIEDTAAVLEAWLMGQAGGGAIAEVLFGKTNPSGKLSETFPQRLIDTPTYFHFPGENGEVRYGEGLYIGYRYYDAKQVPVLFPFGYGLSYTTFEYGPIKLSTMTFNDVDGLVVAVDVTNTGGVAGKEIVQVYVHDREAQLQRPVKELKGFAKIELQPGETKTVTVRLDWRAFAFFHPGYKRWITETGEFDILVGASSVDIRGSQTVTLKSTMALPSILNTTSTMRAWLSDPRGHIVFDPFFQQIKTQMSAVFAGETGDSNAIGMDPMSFMLDIPLISLLQFQEESLPMPATEIVAELLKAVHGMS